MNMHRVYTLTLWTQYLNKAVSFKSDSALHYSFILLQAVRFLSFANPITHGPLTFPLQTRVMLLCLHLPHLLCACICCPASLPREQKEQTGMLVFSPIFK